MIKFLDKAYGATTSTEHQITPHPMPDKLDPWCYDHGDLIDISTIEPSKGWVYHANWEPQDDTGTRNNYTQVPMLISDTPGTVLSTKFRGKAIGIAVAAGQDAGIIEYRIDKGEWQRQNLFTQWSSQLHLPWYYTLANELEATEHQLEIRISQDKYKSSKGHACRIRYLYVNGD
jgi:sialidase-1